MESYSTYVFIAVIMSGVGYMATQTRNFNIWKMGLIAFVAAPIVLNLKDSETAIWVAVIAFFVGLMLPHAHVFDGFFRAGSEAINGIRYRDDRRNIESQKEELKQKEAELRRRELELERLRREYEEAMRNARRSRDDSRAKHKSGEERASKQERQQQSHQERSQRGAGANNSSSNRGRDNNPQRAKCLRILGLDPAKIYSLVEMKRRVRELASKYHPDMHHGKSEEEIRNLTEKMKDVNAASDWLERNSDK
jgi:uncharacterized protein (DUF3084 family)